MKSAYTTRKRRRIRRLSDRVLGVRFPEDVLREIEARADEECADRSKIVRTIVVRALRAEAARGVRSAM